MITTIAHGACALVLLASSVTHLRRPRLLAKALAAHDLLPARSWWPVTAAVIVLEIATAALLTRSALAGDPAASATAAAVAVPLFAAFALYLAAVLRRSPAGADAGCGCGLGDTRVTGWVVVRAAGLSAAAAVGGLAPATQRLLDRPLEQAVVLGCAAGTFAIVAALLPAARALPGDARSARIPR
jgi:hypothetical protein